MTDPWGDFMGGMFGGSSAQRAEETLRRASEKLAKDKPWPQLHRRTIDGEAYIKAVDVAALLRAIGGDRATRLANKLAGPKS